MEGAPRVVPAVAVPAFEAPPAQAGASAIAAPPLLAGAAAVPVAQAAPAAPQQNGTSNERLGLPRLDKDLAASSI